MNIFDILVDFVSGRPSEELKNEMHIIRTSKLIFYSIVFVELSQCSCFLISILTSIYHDFKRKVK